MKKICFAGDLSFAEKSVGVMMKDKLTELLDEFPEEEFDFLFFKCCKLISKQGLYVIQDLKGAYPKRKLTTGVLLYINGRAAGGSGANAIICLPTIMTAFWDR